MARVSNAKRISWVYQLAGREARSELSVGCLSVTERSMTDVSVTDVSMTDVSVTDVSVTDVSMTDISVTDVLATDVSMTDVSMTDVSVTDVADECPSCVQLIESLSSEEASDKVRSKELQVVAGFHAPVFSRGRVVKPRIPEAKNSLRPMFSATL
jgi:hypothetical protein